MDTQKERLITLKEAARLLGVHPLTLSRWAKEGLITLVYLPGGFRQRMTQAELDRIMGQTDKEEDANLPETPHKDY